MAARHFPSIGYGLITAFAVVIVIGAIMQPAATDAHPGATDAFGCHICTDREPCESWGLQVGEYHCHNDGLSKNAPNNIRPPTPEQLHGAARVSIFHRAPKPLSRRARAMMDALSSLRAARSASSSSLAGRSSSTSAGWSSSSRGSGDRDADAYAQLALRYRTALGSLRRLAASASEPTRTDLHLALDYYEEALDDFDRYTVTAVIRPLNTEELRNVVAILRTIDRSLGIFVKLHGAAVR
jgi:hypothetical protein